MQYRRRNWLSREQQRVQDLEDEKRRLEDQIQTIKRMERPVRVAVPFAADAPRSVARGPIIEQSRLTEE